MRRMTSTRHGRPKRKYGGRKVTRLRQIIWATQPHTCWLCGNPINNYAEFEIDHVLPRRHGGTNALTNLRPAHGAYSRTKCNQRRGSKLVTKQRPAALERDDTDWYT